MTKDQILAFVRDSISIVSALPSQSPGSPKLRQFSNSGYDIRQIFVQSKAGTGKRTVISALVIETEKHLRITECLSPHCAKVVEV